MLFSPVKHGIFYQCMSNLPAHIRFAEAADAPALVRLVRALLAHERSSNSSYDLHPWAASEAELLKQLRQPDTRFFVAEQGEALVGYLKVVLLGATFTRAETSWRQWSKTVFIRWCKRIFDALLQRPSANVTPTGGYIAGAYVLPEWRRSHTGHALVAAAENWLREKGMVTSELHVLYANESAREFWASLGYEPLVLGLRKKLSPETNDTESNTQL